MEHCNENYLDGRQFVDSVDQRVVNPGPATDSMKDDEASSISVSTFGEMRTKKGAVDCRGISKTSRRRPRGSLLNSIAVRNSRNANVGSLATVLLIICATIVNVFTSGSSWIRHGVGFWHVDDSSSGRDKNLDVSRSFIPNIFASAANADGLDYLDENSVVLITGGAGFIGSELAMALHRTYNIKRLLCIDSMDSGFGVANLHTSAASVKTQEEWKQKIDKNKIKSRTEQELALFEFKRQRAFHLLQTLGSKVRFYRADLRPTIPEFFDLGEVPLLDTIFTQHSDITHVVHLADSYHGAMFDGSSRGEGLAQAVPRVKDQTKSGMIEAILEQLKKFGEENDGRIPHFTYASTYEVYNHIKPYKDNPNPPPFREEKPITVPSSLRGAAKLIDEVLAASYNSMHGIYSVGLRLFPVYGPWGLPGTPLFEMAERAVSDPNKSILIPSENGVDSENDVRDYVYIDDAIDAIMAAMQYRPPGDKPPPVVINVGSGEQSKIKDVAETMEKYFPRTDGATAVYQDGTAQKEMKESTVSYASLERANALLGYSPQVSIQEGIENLLAWHYDRAFPYGGRQSKEASPGEDEEKIEVSSIPAKGLESCSPFDKECLLGAAVFPCASECAHMKQCTPTFYDEVMFMTRTLTANCDAVLYTVALNENLKAIPSARAAASPESIPYAGVHDQKTGHQHNHCNIAFVSEGSALVQKLKRASGLQQYVSMTEEFLKKVGENGDGNIQGAPVLKYGFWTVVPLLVSAYPAENDLLQMLPKLSPGLFFAERTKYAIYADPNVIFVSIPDLLSATQMQPVGGDAKGATSVLIGQSRIKEDGFSPLANIEQSSVYTRKARDSSAAQGLQERAYDMIRVGLRGEMVGGGASPIVDSKWMVHALDIEDNRLFRCDVFGELMQWGVSSDERAIEFIMGLHDMWTKLFLQWTDVEPWWIGEDVSSEPQVMEARRRLAEDELEEEEDTGNLEGGVDEAQEEEQDEEDDDEILGEPQVTPDEDKGDEEEQDEDEAQGETQAALDEEDPVEDGAQEEVQVVPEEDRDDDEESDEGETQEEPQAAQDEDSSDDEEQAKSVKDEPQTGDEEEEERGGASDTRVESQSVDDAVEHEIPGEEEGQGESRAEEEEEETTDSASQEEIPEESEEEFTESQDSNTVDQWVGVLSSTSTHHFVHIVPSSSVGAIYLDEYSY